MKTILFCNLPYAFSIMKPIANVLVQKGYSYLWYVPKEIVDEFPYNDMPFTSSIKELEGFKSDAIIVPGNDVPYWLEGVKVQIFHGLAGEKKGHFRIRDYFDLYLTQGPYFTQRFNELKQKYKNFEVMETGWSKLDTLFDDTYIEKREFYKKEFGSKKTILYAPTFSPSLTSAVVLQDTIKKLSDEYQVVIKFHDKMASEVVQSYRKIESKNLIISKERDIIPLMQISDIMISDTSSVVYEFILLNKPVITLKSKSENINWANFKEEKELYQEVVSTLNSEDRYKTQREKVISLYHPYTDGKSSYRVVEAIENYLKEYGKPLKRKLPWLRRFKMLKRYQF